jgi:hypothetical protein
MQSLRSTLVIGSRVVVVRGTLAFRTNEKPQATGVAWGVSYCTLLGAPARAI